MADSPRSETFPSRFSTPVNELDDHRFQPESLPRTEAAALHRGRRRSTAATAQPLPDLPQSGFVSRDFEQAIVDDDKSDQGSARDPRQERRGSTSARRNTFRRERPNRSRASSSLSRSVSPPNSVDAFAEPRLRARAGTATSIAPSYLTAHRSNSAGTGPRPLEEDQIGTSPIADESPSGDDSVEDDVCFPPPEEPSAQYPIDFDDLHEFVAQHRERTHVPNPFALKPTISFKTPRVDDPPNDDIVPKIFTHPPTPARRSSQETTSDLNEKEPTLPERRGPRLESFNRWAFFSSELEETIFAPELGDLLMPGETFRNLFELGPEGGCWWLDILMPSEEEVEVICKAFGIHGLTREDIVQQETREKVELFKSYYFLCFRSFYQLDKTSEYYMEPVNIYAVVFREGILTFTFCPSPHAANVRKRMGKLRDYVALGADWICYALIDDIVDSYGPVIRSVEQEADAIEDNVFTARPEDSRALLRQIGECRKTVMSLIRLIGGKADVIKGFAKRCNEQYSIAPRKDVGMYLSDIQDHVVTMMSNLNHFEKMLSRSHSNYLAQLSVDQIVQGNKANAVLSKVTFIATIIVPMNLVCGMFGMNVNVPGKFDDGLDWFFGIISLFVAFGVIGTLVARKMKFF